MAHRKYTDEQLVEAVAASRTIRGVLVRLGLAPYGGNYETVRHLAEDLGIDLSHLSRLSTGALLRRCTDVEVAEAVRASRSFIEALRRLGLKQGGNIGRLRQRVETMGVDTSHMLG